VLAKLLLCYRKNGRVAIKHNRARTGGALIKSENSFHEWHGFRTTKTAIAFETIFTRIVTQRALTSKIRRLTFEVGYDKISSREAIRNVA
jgi:hypothetical protein